MTYIYGPVSSWRYGRSLGVDIVIPPKKCTYNCVYCQLGSTKMHVDTPEGVQGVMPASEDIVPEMEQKLEKLDQRTVDVITFSGTGEPTLNVNIGSILSAIRATAERLPIILLTNASLFPRRDVRRGIIGFDIVTAKYDAGDDETFRRINRPAKGTFSLHEIQDGISQLRREMKGMLALEVMLLRGSRGLTNVKGPPRKALIDGIIEVNPDLVQIYTPWRPAALQSINPVSYETLQDFGEELENHLGPERLWIYGVHDARGNGVKWKTHQFLEDEIIGLLCRRPCRISDISASLGILPSIATCILGKLQCTGDVKTRQVQTDVFYELTH